jgi:chromosome segregation ATPase
VIPFETWRQEISADLSLARETLAAEQEALTAAEAEVLAAKRERREITEAIGRIGQHPVLASALHFRVREHENSLGQVDGKLVRARNDIKNSYAKIKDMEDALQQIETMIPRVEAEVE